MRRFFGWLKYQMFPHWNHRYSIFARVLDVWLVVLLCPIFVVVQSFVVLRQLVEPLYFIWFEREPEAYRPRQREAVLEAPLTYDEYFGELRSLISQQPIREEKLADVMQRLARHYPERSKAELGCYVAPVMRELAGQPLFLVHSPEELEQLDAVFPGLSVEVSIRGRIYAWTRLPKHLEERVLVVTTPSDAPRELEEAVGRVFPVARVRRFSPSSPRINLLPISYNCW